MSDVTTTQIDWRTLVQQADPDREIRDTPVYEFSNGAKFITETSREEKP